MHAQFSVNILCVLTMLLFVDCGFREIRLAGWGNSSTQGRVEICYFNVWGSVCDDMWDALDAKVTCYQLGYSTLGD